MNVAVIRTFVKESRRVEVINRFYNTVHNTTEEYDRPTFAAIVNGVQWTAAQTEQAIRDSQACRCRTCLCCKIARLAKAIDR